MLQDIDSFLNEIILELRKAFRCKELDINKIKNLIAKNNYSLYEKFQKNFEQLEILQNKFLFFNQIYKEIAKFLTIQIQGEEKNKNYEYKNNFASEFLENLLNIFLLKINCAECNSSEISASRYAFNENKVIYYCSNCQKIVKINHNLNVLPLFLLYIYQWTISDNKPSSVGHSITDYSLNFLKRLLMDCFNFFQEVGNLQNILLFYNVLDKNNIDIQEISKNSKDIKNIIIEKIITSLRSGEYSKIKYTLDHLIKKGIDPEIKVIIKDKKYKKQIEENFYLGLSKNLEAERFQNFETLIKNSDKLDIYIHTEKIPKRFEILKKSITQYIQNVSMGYQTSYLGKIIKLINFYNKYNLLEREINEDGSKEIAEITKDNIFISNLKDLFKKVSNGLLLYIRQDLPQILYNFFIEERKTLFYSDVDELINYIKNQFFDSYTIYGLSVRNLGSSLKFIKEFKKKIYDEKSNLKFLTSKEKFFEFNMTYNYPVSFYGELYGEREQKDIKKHLVSPENILNNIDKILSQQYSFLNMSMVLLGGIGPQGHGFTYSTPRGEIIEICSDQRENEAIIIKFKEFMKNKFLKRLRGELEENNISFKTIKSLINHLDKSLTKRELINYSKKDEILKHTKDLIEKSLFQKIDKSTNEAIYQIISESIDIVLRPISMEDQFKTRMNLISENKISPKDIAKLTSLKGKSHYDVLRERFFYQYIVNWFYEIYLKNKKY
ncbi:MAG: hypothetical protein EU550_02140 [Promethearchaeota archaeon]|nr:MAG: hypothetical protein EU550_02140 [Candidatus Lokiarchaeota archaeon]